MPWTSGRTDPGLVTGMPVPEVDALTGKREEHQGHAQNPYHLTPPSAGSLTLNRRETRRWLLDHFRGQGWIDAVATMEQVR